MQEYYGLIGMFLYGLIGLAIGLWFANREKAAAQAIKLKAYEEAALEKALVELEQVKQTLEAEKRKLSEKSEGLVVARAVKS